MTLSSSIVHRYLPNGMEVYLEENAFAPLTSIQVMVKAGSMDEEESEAGSAHFLEHMLFKGSKKFPGVGQIASEVEQMGGDINAYTTFDHTVYYISCSSDFSKKAAEILLDVAQNSALDPEEVEREREVILEEIRRGNDNPNNVLSKSTFRNFYSGSRMGRPVIGFENIVSGLTRDQLYNFYKTWYSPNNMTVVAVGDFSAEDFYAHLAELTKDFSPTNLPSRVRPSLEPWTSSRGELLFGPWQEMRFQLALPAPSQLEEDSVAWDVAASILGNGDTSRLHRTLVDELQVVTAVDSGTWSPFHPSGAFILSMVGQIEQFSEALTASLRVLEQMAFDPPSLSEIRRVIASVEGERVWNRESMEGIARAMVSALHSPWKRQYEERYVKLLKCVTPESLQNVAKTICAHLKEGKFAIAAAVSEEAESTLPAAADLKTQIQSHFQNRSTVLEVASWPEPTASADNPSVKQWRFPLPGGRELHVNWRANERISALSAQLACRSGAMREPRGLHGVGSLMTSLLTHGTRNHPYRIFAEEVEDRGASISSSLARDVFSMRMDALSQHAKPIFKLMLEALVSPAFEMKEFLKLQKETIEHLILQKDSPNFRLGRMTLPLLYPSHPYELPLIGTPTVIESISLSDIHERHKDLLSAQTFVLSLAGDFDLKWCAEETIKALSGWILEAGDVPLASASDWAPLPTGGPRLGFDRLEREQAHINLCFRTVPLSDPRRTHLEMASQILGGQGGRLFLDLRDKRSLAYSVSASQAPNLLGGYYSLYIGTAAQKTLEAVEGLHSHLMELAENPPTQIEMERAQRGLILSQATESQHLSYQASQLCMSDLYDMPFDNFLRFRNRVESVQAEDVSRTLRDCLKLSPLILGIVGPKGTPVPEWNS